MEFENNIPLKRKKKKFQNSNQRRKRTKTSNVWQHVTIVTTENGEQKVIIYFYKFNF